MKHTKLVLAAALVAMYATSSIAQSTIASNILTGAPAAPPEYLGSFTGHDVIFRSANQYRMRIDVNGRLLFNTNNLQTFNAGADISRLTFDVGADNYVLNTLSTGQNPRIYFQTRPSGTPATQNQFLGHAVTGLFTPPNTTSSTSGIYWNNFDYFNFRSDIHINARTTINIGTNGNAISVTQNAGMVGIRNTNPQNRLEITSLGTDPQPAGLRFTNLTSVATPVTNPGTGVLSVNASGDVIYVKEDKFGNNCWATSNPMTSHYEIPMGGFNYYFTGQGIPTSSNNTVSVGYSCGLLPAKFSVLQNFGSVAMNTTAGSFINRDIGTTGASIYRGVQGIVDNTQTIINVSNIGGEFSGANAPVSSGVRGSALLSSMGVGYGGKFFTTSSFSGTSNHGIHTSATGPGGTNYGIYATATGGALNYC